MSAFDAYVQAAFHGGTMAGGPTFTVVHDAETPLEYGYCDAIVEFFRKGPKAGTSAHAMVGPEKAVKLLPDNVIAWAAGPKANPRGWHLEQTGYARFARADWTTDKGLAQLGRAAACLREVHDQWDIPKRWCTDDQLRRAAAGDRVSGGMATHQQVSRVLGGTTHTDPEDNYPRDLLLQAVLNGDDDMPSAAEVADAILNTTIRQNGRFAGKELTTLAGMLAWNNDNWQETFARIAALQAEVDELRKTLGTAGGAVGSAGPSVAAIADAVSDEQDRRARDGDPATGPVS